MAVRLLFPLLTALCLFALGCAQPPPEMVEVPVTVEVLHEVPVTVEVEKVVEVQKDVPVTVEVEKVVEKEVEIVRSALQDVTFDPLMGEAFDAFDTNDDRIMDWYEACAGLGSDLDQMANIWLLLLRYGWAVRDDEASSNAYIETFYWTNEELCERWDWQEY